MSTWDDYRLICMHGVQEGLDSHNCPKCQALAAEIGLTPLRSGYIFTHEPTVEERKRMKESDKN